MNLRLYMDEDAMDQMLVAALRARSVDVITALDAGMIEQDDRAHLEYATEQSRVLCTFNVGDFCKLHNEYLTHERRHAGIILMRQQSYGVGEILRRLLRLIANKSDDETMPWLEFLSAWGN